MHDAKNRFPSNELKHLASPSFKLNRPEGMGDCSLAPLRAILTYCGEMTRRSLTAVLSEEGREHESRRKGYPTYIHDRDKRHVTRPRRKREE